MQDVKQHWQMILVILIISGVFVSRFVPIGGQHVSEERAEVLVVEEGAALIDVRSPSEFTSGHIEGALNLPLNQIETLIVAQFPAKDTLIVLYCQTGFRSSQAIRLLTNLGYTHVYDMGAMSNWPYGIVY
ncbi:MAG: rhodanese-like domain-containing protein [Defluviitaleaceae bacterium]|nr:rhodanese-like domain-containing protein [Defluviitaleaceae bacterium]